MTDFFWQMTACEVVDLLENKEIKPFELLDQIQTRYHDINPIINAIPTSCFERAFDIIKRHDEHDLNFNQPLFGLPIPLKDSFKLGGVRTTFGSLAFENFVPDSSDLIALQLEDKGGVIFGKSNTPEFEAGASTFNKVFGITRNPWNTSKSVAGSSGGAAAAVASGIAFIAQGSDFACSIRFPAAFCGIVGLRPTPGLIPQGPSRLPYQTLSVLGPLARNVSDVGLAMDAMVGYNFLDPLTTPIRKNNFRAAASRPKKPKKISFSFDMGGAALISKEVKDSLLKVASKLKQESIEVAFTCPDMADAAEIFRPLRAAYFSALWSDVMAGSRNLLKPDVVWNIEQGLRLSLSDVAKAENMRSTFRRRLLEFLDVHNFLVLPAAPVTANDALDTFVKEIDGVMMNDYLEWLTLGFAISLTGCPSISIPCGFSDKQLPIGLQLVGKPHTERSLLRTAAWFEATLKQSITVPVTPVKGHKK